MSNMSKIQKLMQRYNDRCYFCGRTVVIATPTNPAHATIDHDMPKARGGDNCPLNLLLACVRCNTAKGDMTGMEFKQFIRTSVLPESYIFHLTERIKKQLGDVPAFVRAHAERVAAARIASQLKTDSAIGDPLVRAVLDKFPGAKIVAVDFPERDSASPR